MLKILYSSIFQNDIIDYNKCIYPKEGLYSFDNNKTSVTLKINFDNIIKFYKEGKIIPQRAKLFEVLNYYYKTNDKIYQEKYLRMFIILIQMVLNMKS